MIEASGAGPQLTIIRHREPTSEMAQLAQEIGQEAWLEQFPERATRMDRMFDPTNPEMAKRWLQVIQQKREGVALFRSEGIGRFVGVVAYLGEEAVGYAVVMDDMSGSNAAKKFKKAMGREPYAYTMQINVLKKHQAKGIGSSMTNSSYEPFDPSQQPTWYVFEENSALGWFKRRGGKSNEEEPTPKPDYYGKDTDMVFQWRLVAPSTAEMQKLNAPHIMPYTLLEAA